MDSGLQNNDNDFTFISASKFMPVNVCHPK